MNSRETCEAYRRALAAGETTVEFVGRFAGMEGVNRSAIWRRLRSGGALPPYNTTPKKYPYKPKSEYKASAPLPPRVKRDPCPRCGVRSDVGCNHRRVTLGTAFG